MTATKKRLCVLGVLFLLLVGWAGWKLFRPAQPGLRATGTIEVTRADVTPRTGGYLQEWQLQVGDQVERGQVLGRVARADLAAQVLRDELALVKAQAQLRDLQQGPREQELQEARANLASALAVQEKADGDWRRLRQLYQEGAISAQQWDGAQSAAAVARQNVAALQQRLSLLEAGNRPEVVEAQRLEVERSQAILAASRSLLEDTVVPAPLSGLVLAKNYETREYVAPGAAIATIGDLQDCWVKIYLPSSQLGLIQVGTEAQVKVDSFPERTFRGSVREISQNAEFTPRQSLTPQERTNLVFAVKVRLDNAEGLLKPGMPADVVLP